MIVISNFLFPYLNSVNRLLGKSISSQNYILRWLFIVPTIFLVYSIITLFCKDISNELMIKFRRIYYSICLFGIVLMINVLDLSKITISNDFGFPPIVCSIFFIFVVGIFVSVILFSLIISATDFKEISLGWARISKEDLKQNIIEQKTTNDNLLNKIEAEFEVIQNIGKYFNDNQIENKLRTNYQEFQWENEFKNLVQYYCNFQNTNIDVYIFNVCETNFDSELRNTFKLTSNNIHSIKENVLRNKSTFVSLKNDLLFIPYKPLYYNDKIMIVLKGKNNCIFEIEQRFILNIIKLFEDFSTDVLASIAMS